MPSPDNIRRAVTHRASTLAIVPAFNEADSLPFVLKELRRDAPSLDILVVSDGSTDGTASVARDMGVPVAELPFNIGIGAALRTGFAYAVDHGYTRAIQFDADGQHDASQIPVLLEALGDGADLAIGSRFTEGTPVTYEVSWMRWQAMRFLRAIVNLAVRKHFSDTSSGFRALSRPMLEYFAANYPLEYMDSVEALVLACNAGFTIKEVPVVMHERRAGMPSNRSLRLVLNYLRVVIGVFGSARRRERR